MITRLKAHSLLEAIIAVIIGTIVMCAWAGFMENFAKQVHDFHNRMMDDLEWYHSMRHIANSVHRAAYIKIPDEEWNWLALCRYCHAGFHSIGRYSFALRYPIVHDKIKSACEKMGRTFDKEGKK